MFEFVRRERYDFGKSTSTTPPIENCVMLMCSDDEFDVRWREVPKYGLIQVSSNEIYLSAYT